MIKKQSPREIVGKDDIKDYLDFDYCKCGCGTIIYNTDKWGKPVKYAKGHFNLKYNWHGHISSYERYCPLFNESKKEEIRDKYMRRCLLCDKTEEENGKKLSVHHIDYNKEQGCNEHEWRLVPLCHSCHSKTNGNRKMYERRLRIILEVI